MHFANKCRHRQVRWSHASRSESRATVRPACPGAEWARQHITSPTDGQEGSLVPSSQGHVPNKQSTPGFPRRFPRALSRPRPRAHARH